MVQTKSSYGFYFVVRSSNRVLSLLFEREQNKKVSFLFDFVFFLVQPTQLLLKWALWKPQKQRQTAMPNNSYSINKMSNFVKRFKRAQLQAASIRHFFEPNLTNILFLCIQNTSAAASSSYDGRVRWSLLKPTMTKEGWWWSVTAIHIYVPPTRTHARPLK